MYFASVPIIVVCCYVLGELYKLVFRKKTQAYKFIPITMCVIGGMLGIIMFYTEPTMIFDADNAWIALGVGMVSGVSATGTNQIIKQLFGKNEESKEKENENDYTSQK